MKSISSVLGLLGALATTVNALDPINVQEQEFIDSGSGDRFVLLGVDYQPGGPSAVTAGSGDPLSNPDACLRDAALMQNLGVNTIRVYNVDATANHDLCASIFNAVGIYMLIDVNSAITGQYLNRADPGPSYTTGYLTHVFSVIEAFKDYPNLLGFNSGNEIINTQQTGQTCPPYIRAVQRDMKNYISNNANRAIPVGYAADDTTTALLQDQYEYLQCEIDGTTDPSRSDFFGLNDYEWCGTQSSFTISGYNVLIEIFAKSTIPTFFSEYGCIVPLPRPFDEVTTLYGPKMTVMSGGLVYEWTEEPDPANYGLIQVTSDGGAKILPDYWTLKSKYDLLNVKLLTSQNNTATSLKPPTCNAGVITGGQGFSTDFNLPDTPSGAVDLINNGIPNPPKGSIVDVKTTSVAVPVYQTNGAKITGLTIKTGATMANYPGAATNAAGSSGSSSGSSDSGTSSAASSKPAAGSLKNAAGVRGLALALVGVAFGAMMIVW